MRWLDGIPDSMDVESEWTLGVGDGQGGLVCCNSWGRKESDMTERLNWTELKGSWWSTPHTVYANILGELYVKCQYIIFLKHSDWCKTRFLRWPGRILGLTSWEILASVLTYDLISAIRSITCSVEFSSVTQSCPTLCDPMNRSTPGLPVHHQLPESTQTHVHWVGDALQLFTF